MIIILNLFLQNFQACYDQQTYIQLDLQKEIINVFLSSTNDSRCIFPDGIMGVLQFPDDKMDVTQIFNEFNYQTTNTLVFKCTNCVRYDSASDISLVIDSIGTSTELSVGAIQNLRFDQIQCQNVSILIGSTNQIVTANFKCFQLAGADSFKEAIIQLYESSELILEFESGVVSIDSDNIVVTFQNSELYQVLINTVYSIVVNIKGSISKLYFETQLSIQHQAFEHQINIFDEINFVLYEDQVAFNPTYNKDRLIELQTWIQAESINEFLMTVTIQYQNKVYVLKVIENIDNMLKMNRLQCNMVVDSENCQDLMNIMSTLDVNYVKAFLTIQYLQNKKVVNAAAFQVTHNYLSCFKDVSVNIQNSVIKIHFLTLGSFCIFATSADTNFITYGYLTKQDVELNQNQQLIAQFQIENYNSTQLTLDIPIDTETYNTAIATVLLHPYQYRLRIQTGSYFQSILISQFEVDMPPNIWLSIIFLCSYCMFMIVFSILLVVFETMLKGKFLSKFKINKQFKKLDVEDF
eukprot:EST42791.1 Hypothetical protein SS50377_17560 [Spironucleus salmonicida]